MLTDQKDLRDVEQGDLIVLVSPQMYKLIGLYAPSPWEKDQKDQAAYLVLEKIHTEAGIVLELWSLQDQKKASISGWAYKFVFLISRPEKETDSWAKKFFARASQWLGL